MTTTPTPEQIQARIEKSIGEFLTPGMLAAADAAARAMSDAWQDWSKDTDLSDTDYSNFEAGYRAAIAAQPAAMREECNRLADLLDPLSRKRPLDNLSCAVAAKFLREVAAAPIPQASEPPVAPAEPAAWRCFHCDETFKTSDEAKVHFGPTEYSTPACQINAAEYREMEERMRRYNDEDADIHRQMYGMQGEHATALLREEEKGYARGLADAQKHPEDLGLMLVTPNPTERARVPMTHERWLAVRGGRHVAAEEKYFKARPQLDDDECRSIFYAGFCKGYEAGEPASDGGEA